MIEWIGCFGHEFGERIFSSLPIANIEEDRIGFFCKMSELKAQRHILT